MKCSSGWWSSLLILKIYLFLISIYCPAQLLGLKNNNEPHLFPYLYDRRFRWTARGCSRRWSRCNSPHRCRDSGTGRHSCCSVRDSRESLRAWSPPSPPNPESSRWASVNECSLEILSAWKQFLLKTQPERSKEWICRRSPAVRTLRKAQKPFRWQDDDSRVTGKRWLLSRRQRNLLECCQGFESRQTDAVLSTRAARSKQTIADPLSPLMCWICCHFVLSVFHCGFVLDMVIALGRILYFFLHSVPADDKL